MRLPRVASACRLFSDNLLHPDLPVLIAGVVVALALTMGSALAQAPAKGSPDHIKATTSAIDGAMIRANTAMSNDWPTVGLDYAEGTADAIRPK